MMIPETRLREAADALVERIDRTLSETGNRFPYVVDSSGNWETTPNGNWCGGHWIGLLWFARDATDGARSDRFERAAREHTERMREYMPRDSMFCGMNFAYAGFGGYDRTGDRDLFGLGLEGADAMRRLYDERARQVPLGELNIRGPEQFRGPESDHGPSGTRIGAVDNVYTALPVLWRAYRETGDPTFRDTALSHADRHLDLYVRPDGRTWHHAVFDDDGSAERQYNELAQSDETCWARGQGWNIAGLVRAYLETEADRFRVALERTVEYYRQNAKDGVPPWDFEVERTEGTPLDTSAAALTAYGLLRLPASEPTDDLRAHGAEILGTLLEDHLVTNPNASNYGGVLHGCFNKPGEYATDTELIWTDYYVARTVESMLRK